LLHNPHAIRAIQLGPAAAVCPSNRSAHTHTSVTVLNKRPLCNSDLNCQPLPVNLRLAGDQQHWISAYIYCRHCDVVNQSIIQFTWCSLSCLAAAMHHMSCTTCNESVCAPTVQSLLHPLLAHLQTSSLPVHPKHSSNSCRGLGRCCLSACPD